MRFDDHAPVTQAKLNNLRDRIARLRIDLSQVDETFVRGGGKGGQKINKTSSAVVLRYEPLRIVVRCQRERERSINRFLALRELVDRVEMAISPGTSERLKERDRSRRQKDRRRRRSGI